MRKLCRSLSVLLAAVATLTVIGCSNQPVAIVNGSRISKKEFYDRLEQTGGQQVLADLIARRMLQSQFDAAKLQVTDAEINGEIQKLRERAPDDAAWQGFLKQQGMTEVQFKDFVTFQLKVKKLAEKDVKYTDQDLQKFFEKYRMQFGRPATVTLSEIVVADKAKADQIRQQLNDPKASFATLARQNSLSGYTRERGGVRPEEPITQVMPEGLRGIVANMTVGQISQPIKADSQWYIVKLDAKNPAEKADFSNPKIKERVKEQYVLQNARQVQDIIEEARNTARVQILDPKYKDMEKMFGKPQQALPSFGEQRPEGAKAPAAAPAPAGQPAAPAPPAGQQPAAPAVPAS
ncbi:MAG: peptidyl-prolyl cis-trans isomerase [Armatimonadia bacterium]